MLWRWSIQGTIGLYIDKDYTLVNRDLLLNRMKVKWHFIIQREFEEVKGTYNRDRGELKRAWKDIHEDTEDTKSCDDLIEVLTVGHSYLFDYGCY